MPRSAGLRRRCFSLPGLARSSTDALRSVRFPAPAALYPSPLISDALGSANGQAQVLKNVDGLLAGAGSSKKSVLKATCFLKDMNHFNDFNGVYAEYWGENKPARSCVEVARLPKDVLVEIEVIAIEEK